MTKENNTTTGSIEGVSTSVQVETKQATQNDDNKIPALPATLPPKNSDEDGDKGKSTTIHEGGSLVVTEDDNVKPDTTMAEATTGTSNNSLATGDVELTASFPQKVMLINYQYQYQYQYQYVFILLFTRTVTYHLCSVSLNCCLFSRTCTNNLKLSVS
jgi:hypothetical protein